MGKTEEINISWEGPFTIDDIISGNIDKEKYEVKNTDIGLYQIYGSHPLYGDGVLVYIGRTVDSFKSRLQGRWVVEDGTDANNVKIYLGTIFSDHEEVIETKVIKSRIEKAEVLLINAMKPAFNSSNIQSAKKFDNFSVYNYGSYRSIYPILDSNYFWNGFKNIAIVNKILNENTNIKIEQNDESDGYYGFKISKEFIDIDNYNFWFGVDYTLKEPLVLQIDSNDENIMNQIKESKEFKLTNYSNDRGNDVAYKFIEIAIFNNCTDKNNSYMQVLKNKIIEIVKCLK